jgi:hypothetical protein
MLHVEAMGKSMSTTEEFHARTRGSHAEDEDWYRLVTEDDGTRFVEHEWSYTNPYPPQNSDDGTQRMTVDEFLSGDYDANAKNKLRELISLGCSGFDIS